jgi:glycosyltransferase involved in cell wall biosynthesis
MQPERKVRLAYLVSHPIQYQAPLLRLIAAQPDIDLTVFFQSDISVRRFHDPDFGVAIAWDTPLLEGYRHRFLPALGATDSITGFRPYSYGIGARLRRGGFDVLWVHGYTNWFNWVALLAARRAGIATLVRDEANAISAPRSRAKVRLKRAFFGALSAMCGGFLAIGSLNRDYYLANGVPNGRVFMVPYAVDNAFFSAAAAKASAERQEFRRGLGLAAGRPVILFASKFQRRKRPDDLLAAFIRLAAQAPERKPYLLLVGDGEMRPALESTARPLGDDVRILGFRNQSELPALFDLCDVFVLPSESEPWGLVVNEAMNAGRAVIVSDQVGCAPDLVRPGLNGEIFPVGDVTGLADALRRVVGSPDRISAMGRASADIIAGWGFEQDLAGLRQAMAAVKRPVRG